MSKHEHKNIQFKHFEHHLFILDSEWNDECIDFIMMCFFFLYLCLALWFGAVKLLRFTSIVGILFDEKVNLVGAFGRSNFKITNIFQKRREKQHKN